jgi:Domain of unknown function (DUF4304)
VDLFPVHRGRCPRRMGCHAGEAQIECERPNNGLELTRYGIHVVNVQGSQSARGCFINLGAHLLGLPTAGGGAPTAIPKEYECAFRARVDPPHDIGTGMWPYGESQEAPDAIGQRMVEEFNRQGNAFSRGTPPIRARLLTWSAPLSQILHTREMGLHLRASRFGSHLTGSPQIARRALNDTAPSATLLHASLRRLLDGEGAA